MGRTNTVKGGQPHSSAQHGPQPPAVSWPWVSTLQTGMGITKRRFLKSCQLSPLSVKGHPPLSWPGFPEFLSLHSQGDSFLFLLPSNINLHSYRRNIRRHPAQVSWRKYLPWNRPSKWNVISKGSCFLSLKNTELQWELQVKYSVSYVLHREMVQDSKLLHSSRWKHGNVDSLQSPQIPGVIHSELPRLLLVTVIGGDWDAVFLGYPNQRAWVSCTF